MYSDNITATDLDNTLDSIIKKSRNSSKPTGKVGSNKTRSSPKQAGRNVAARTQRNTSVRRSGDARNQKINKARGLTSLSTSKKGITSRPTRVASQRARNLASRAIQRSHRPSVTRQPRVDQRLQRVNQRLQRVNQRVAQRSQTARPRNTNLASPSKNLRITVSNRLTTQRRTNTSVFTNRVRSTLNRRQNTQSPLRLGLNALATRARSNSNQRYSNQRGLNQRSLNLKRDSRPNNQRQVNARLSQVRASNQSRQASVIAQRRGIQTNNNNNSRGTGSRKNTLDARFSQQQRVVRTQGQGVRNVSYGNQRNNNNQRNNQRSNNYNNNNNQRNNNYNNQRRPARRIPW